MSNNLKQKQKGEHGHARVSIVKQTDGEEFPANFKELTTTIAEEFTQQQTVKNSHLDKEKEQDKEKEPEKEH